MLCRLCACGHMLACGQRRGRRISSGDEIAGRVDMFHKLPPEVRLSKMVWGWRTGWGVFPIEMEHNGALKGAVPGWSYLAFVRG